MHLLVYVASANYILTSDTLPNRTFPPSTEFYGKHALSGFTRVCEREADHWPGPLLPGMSWGMGHSAGRLSERMRVCFTIQMLFPFNNVWFNLVVFFP